MSTTQTSAKSQLLTDLPPYIYGTTRLGVEKLPFDDRVNVARAAMEGVDWFHTSHTYGNPLQRFPSNELWDMLLERNEPMIAMRTVSGGDIYRLRDVPGYAWKPYLQQRAAAVAPIFERSGVESWTEFCVRFAHSFPQVRATVGATSRLENLREFLRAAQNIQPLPADLLNEIVQLHYRWSDELDMHAEPWTM